MARLIRRRSLTVVALAALLVVVTGSVAAAPFVMPHLTGWLSGRQGQGSQSQQVARPHPRGTPVANAAPRGPASVQLVSQDLTPSTQLGVAASGFLGKEHLDVTIQDPQGRSYEQVTLVAGDDGGLRETSIALPQQLAAGDYQLVVVGDASHRTANAAFRMHVVPPTVTLDAYTGVPGQDIGFAGSGFIPGEEVQVRLGSSTSPLASVKATDVGAVSGRLKVPALAPGAYTFTLVGAVSKTPTSVGVTVQGFKPWVVLTRYALTPGERLGFNGQGFAPGEPVLVYLNSVQSKPVMTLTADAAGQVIVQDTWTPDAASGRNVLTLVGQSSGGTTTAEFTILSGPQPTPAPSTP